MILSGWTNWRWAGLVLVGTAPDGQERSLGEVERRTDGRIVAVLNHPNGSTPPLERVASTVQFARKVVLSWVAEHGGSPPRSPGTFGASGEDWAAWGTPRRLHVEVVEAGTHTDERGVDHGAATLWGNPEQLAALAFGPAVLEVSTNGERR